MPTLQEEIIAEAANMHGTYEWIVSYDEIKHLLSPSFLKTSPSGRTMNLGCGTSEMGADLVRDGYEHVVNVDIDDKHVESMRARHDGNAALSWVVCDMTNAKGVYPSDGVFDCVIDKATLDALMCTDEASHLYCEVHRLLRGGGVYVVVSFRPKEMMQKMLVAPGAGFELETHAIPRAAPPSLPPLRAGVGTSREQLEKHGHVYVLRKMDGGRGVRVSDVKSFQDDVIRWWHNEQDPLVSADEMHQLVDKFAAALSKAGLDPLSGRLPLKEAYLMMFDEWLREGEYGYDFENFVDDLRAYDEECVDHGMRALDAVGFMKEMQ